MTHQDRPRLRRRDLLGAALAAGLAAPAVARGEDRDAAILRDLIAREDAAAFAYRGQQLSGLGDPAGQDEDHAKALRVELQGLIEPGAPHNPPLDPAARRLNDARGDERRAAALALEADLVAQYHEAVLGITEPAILQTAATILACHAQRRALLSYPP